MRSLHVVAVVICLCGCVDWNLPDWPDTPDPTHLDILESAISIPEGESQSLTVRLDHCNMVDSYCVTWSSSDYCVADEVFNSVYGWHSGSVVLRAFATERPSVRDSVFVTITPVVAASLRLAVDSVAIELSSFATVPVRFYDAAEHWIHRPAVPTSADTLVVLAKPIDTCTTSTDWIELLPRGRGTTIVIAQFEGVADTVHVTVF